MLRRSVTVTRRYKKSSDVTDFSGTQNATRTRARLLDINKLLPCSRWKRVCSLGLRGEKLSPAIKSRQCHGNGKINPASNRCQITESGAKISAMEEPMSDEALAELAKNLARALMRRARSRSSDDEKSVLALQSQLVAEVAKEEKIDVASLVFD